MPERDLHIIRLPGVADADDSPRLYPDDPAFYQQKLLELREHIAANDTQVALEQALLISLMLEEEISILQLEVAETVFDLALLLKSTGRRDEAARLVQQTAHRCGVEFRVFMNSFVDDELLENRTAQVAHTPDCRRRYPVRDAWKSDCLISLAETAIMLNEPDRAEQAYHASLEESSHELAALQMQFAALQLLCLEAQPPTDAEQAINFVRRSLGTLESFVLEQRIEEYAPREYVLVQPKALPSVTE